MPTDGDRAAGRGARGPRGARASSFGAAAAAYAEHRPGYPAAAVRWAIAPASGRRPLRAVDLGAGTGKLTAALAGLGAEVTAVEPDPAMLAEFRRVLPGVTAVAGRAESIPLPDGSADAVLAGQAAHWFDMGRALPEIARVLAPGGVLAGLWNTEDDRAGWVAGLDRAVGGLGGAPLSRWRSEVAGSRLVRESGTRPGAFGPAEVAEFPHGQRRTTDSFAATMATHSAVLLLDLAGRERLLARLRAYLAAQPETAPGEFTVPLVTGVIRAVRR